MFCGSSQGIRTETLAVWNVGLLIIKHNMRISLVVSIWVLHENMGNIGHVAVAISKQKLF